MMKIKDILSSPTLMTLFSLSSKSLNFILITPFLLASFSAEEIAFWYLLGIFINMQALADFGFYNTFVRFIALALSGGCSSIEDLKKIENRSRTITSPNIPLAGRIIGTMKRTYVFLTCLLLLVLTLLSPLLYKSVTSLEEPVNGWICWGIVVFFSFVNFSGRPYSNFLLAQNKVALVRRWEGSFNLIALILNILVVFFFKSLILLVLTNQICIAVNVVVNRYLVENVEGIYKYHCFSSYTYDNEAFRYIWPLAWRAGLSSLTTQGVVSASGLIYAQVSTAASASSYLFAEKLYTALRSFSTAPFYSKIPLLVTLRGQEKVGEWEQVAQKGMFYASSIMVLGIVFFDLFGSYLFSMVKSNVDFPDHLLWLLLGWAYLLHRYGAMHTQLYTTINKVNSHISDIVAGIIMIIVWISCLNVWGVYVFPVGMLCGYLGFYIWFAGYFSYKVIESHIYQFEFKANMIPGIILFVYTLGVFVF